MRKIAFIGNSLQTMWQFRSGVLTTLAQMGYEVVVIAPQDSDTIPLQKANIRFIPIQIDSHGMNPISDIRLMLQLKHIYRNEHFDLVFHYTIKPIIYGGWAAARTATAYIAVVTGLGYTFLSNNWITKLTKWLYRTALRHAKNVWFLNQDDQTIFIDQRIVSPTRTQVIPGEGVDTTFYHSTLPPTAPFTFLFVGRLLWHKGISEFVDAAKIVLQKYPKVEFHVVGSLEKPHLGATIQHINQWTKTGIITYLGETTDIRPFVQQAHCIVLPSYREGLSRVLLEAAAMQRPIITTQVPGCQEIVENGENGLLCMKQHALSLAQCMLQLLTLTDDDRQRMGEKGREKVCTLFDEKIIIKHYINTLTELL